MLNTSDQNAVKKLISDIIDGEEALFNHPDIHEKVRQNAKRKLEVKEMTVLALLEDNDISFEHYTADKEKEIKRRVNIHIQMKKQNPNIPDKNIGGRSWLLNLIDYDDTKLVKKYLFSQQISNLSEQPEDLLFTAIKNNSVEMTRLLLQYGSNISNKSKHFISENKYKNPLLSQIISSAIERDIINEHVKPITLSVYKKFAVVN